MYYLITFVIDRGSIDEEVRQIFYILENLLLTISTAILGRVKSLSHLKLFIKTKTF